MGALVRVGKAAVSALKASSALLDLAELSVVTLAGAGAAVAAVVGLPAYLIWHLARTGHVLAGVLVLGAVGVLALNLVRDLKRRELGWISSMVAAIVTVWCAFVILRVVFA